MADVFALDTSVYIRALRDGNRLGALKRFLIRAGTRVRVSAVVALELRAGARTGAQEQAVGDLIELYGSRGRAIVPSLAAYVESGRVLATLGTREGVDVSRAGSLVNDVLIATSCREAQVQLVTENTGDFAMLQRHLRGFRFIAAHEAIA